MESVCNKRDPVFEIHMGLDPSASPCIVVENWVQFGAQILTLQSAGDVLRCPRADLGLLTWPAL